MFIKIQYNLTEEKENVNSVFTLMIGDMESNRKLSVKVTELFLRGRKLNFLLVFTSQSA